MQRGFGRVGMVIDSPPMTSSLVAAQNSQVAAAVPVRELTIEVPGASNAFNPTQSVHLVGRAAFNATMSADWATDPEGCPCQFSAYIRDMESGVASPAQIQAFSSPTHNVLVYTVHVEALFSAPPGSRTYQLEVELWRAIGDDQASFPLHSSSSLSAMTFPFDAFTR